MDPPGSPGSQEGRQGVRQMSKGIQGPPDSKNGTSSCRKSLHGTSFRGHRAGSYGTLWSKNERKGHPQSMDHRLYMFPYSFCALRAGLQHGRIIMRERHRPFHRQTPRGKEFHVRPRF